MKFVFRDNSVNAKEPLLYRIIIGSRLYYIGCADCADRPLKDYARNVKRMKNGKPYRKGNPSGFRAIHQHLFAASEKGEEIVVELIRNVLKTEKFREEAAEIIMHRTLHGEALLNGTHSIRKKTANKALEPTTMPVTFRANARTAPGMVAAQFERWAKNMKKRTLIISISALLIAALVILLNRPTGYAQVQIADLGHKEEIAVHAPWGPFRTGSLFVSAIGMIDGTAKIHVYSNKDRDYQTIELTPGKIQIRIGGAEEWVDDLRVVYEPQTVKKGDLLISLLCGINQK
jgi:hypothetical protein